jgi:hypothetical protein
MSISDKYDVMPPRNTICAPVALAYEMHPVLTHEALQTSHPSLRDIPHLFSHPSPCVLRYQNARYVNRPIEYLGRNHDQGHTNGEASKCRNLMIRTDGMQM